MAKKRAITTTNRSNGLLSQEDIDILVASGVIPPNTPPAQIQLFGKVCERKRLDPFCREIHLTSYNTTKGTRYAMIIGIDGRRIIASRTGQYAGNDDYVYDGGKSEFQMISEGKKRPTTATATVWRIIAGQRCAFTATASWAEYVPQGNKSWMWDKMSFLMLGKTSENLAFKKGFPEEFSGLYGEEEAVILEQENGSSEEAHNMARLPHASVLALTELIEGADKKVVDACKSFKVESLDQLSEEQYTIISKQLTALIKKRKEEKKMAEVEAIEGEVEKSSTMSYAERVEADMGRMKKKMPQEGGDISLDDVEKVFENLTNENETNTTPNQEVIPLPNEES
jgi:phage recombination protein Bet